MAPGDHLWRPVLGVSAGQDPFSRRFHKLAGETGRSDRSPDPAHLPPRSGRPEAADALGVRKDFQKPFQAPWLETPVLHAPNQLHGMIGEPTQTAPQIVECLPGWVMRRGWYIFDKSINCNSMIPAVVRRQQAGSNSAGQLVRLGDGQMQCRSSKQIQPANGPGAKPGNPAKANPPGNRWRRKRAGVKQNQASETLWQRQGSSQPDGSAPIVHISVIRCKSNSRISRTRLSVCCVSVYWYCCGLSLSPQPI